MPWRASRCDSSRPAGPAPMIATWVRMTAACPQRVAVLDGSSAERKDCPSMGQSGDRACAGAARPRSARTQPELTVTELARRTGLPLTTTHRLAGELVAGGALERGEDGRYRIGLRLWEIASLAPRGLGLRERRDAVPGGRVRGHPAERAARRARDRERHGRRRRRGRLPGTARTAQRRQRADAGRWAAARARDRGRPGAARARRPGAAGAGAGGAAAAGSHPRP